MGYTDGNGEPRLVAFADLSEETAAGTDWLWYGYLARRYLTLIDSLWKSGKSTLIGHFLRAMFTGCREFLGLDLQVVPTLIVTEEDLSRWKERIGDLPRDTPIYFESRPFLTRPRPELWMKHLEQLCPLIQRHSIGLVVIDPIANLIFGNENDAGAVSDFMMPLNLLKDLDCAIWLIHHPRKADGTEGRAARGSGNLAGSADIQMEFRRKDGDEASRVRRLKARGRFNETPQSLLIELSGDGLGYRVLSAQSDATLSDMGRTVKRILASKPGEAQTVLELLQNWPPECDLPNHRSVYNLVRTMLNIHWEREGAGTRASPYRYRAISPEPNTPTIPPADTTPPVNP